MVEPVIKKRLTIYLSLKGDKLEGLIPARSLAHEAKGRASQGWTTGSPRVLGSSCEASCMAFSRPSLVASQAQGKPRCWTPCPGGCGAQGPCLGRCSWTARSCTGSSSRTASPTSCRCPHPGPPAGVGRLGGHLGRCWQVPPHRATLCWATSLSARHWTTRRCWPSAVVPRASSRRRWVPHCGLIPPRPSICPFLPISLH